MPHPAGCISGRLPRIHSPVPPGRPGFRRLQDSLQSRHIIVREGLVSFAHRTCFQDSDTASWGFPRKNGSFFTRFQGISQKKTVSPQYGLYFVCLFCNYLSWHVASMQDSITRGDNFCRHCLFRRNMLIFAASAAFLTESRFYQSRFRVFVYLGQNVIHGVQFSLCI